MERSESLLYTVTSVAIGLMWLQVGVSLPFLIIPALFATVFVVAGAIGPRNNKPVPSLPEPDGKPVAIEVSSEDRLRFECSVYEDRALEQKMVDGDLLSVSEMSTCDNTKCLNCLKTRDALTAIEKEERRQAVGAAQEAKFDALPPFQQFQQLKKYDERYAGWTFADYQTKPRLPYEINWTRVDQDIQRANIIEYHNRPTITAEFVNNSSIKPTYYYDPDYMCFRDSNGRRVG